MKSRALDFIAYAFAPLVMLLALADLAGAAVREYLATDGSNRMRAPITVDETAGADALYGEASISRAGPSNNTFSVGNPGLGYTELMVDGPIDVGILPLDPVGVVPALYYNSTSDRFRCFQGVEWQDCSPTQDELNARYLQLDGGAISGTLYTRGQPALLGSGDLNIGTDGGVVLRSGSNAPLVLDNGGVHPQTGPALQVTRNTYSGLVGGITYTATIRYSSATKTPLLFQGYGPTPSVTRCTGGLSGTDCSVLSVTTLNPAGAGTVIGAAMASDGFPTAFIRESAVSIVAVHCLDELCLTKTPPNPIAVTLDDPGSSYMVDASRSLVGPEIGVVTSALATGLGGSYFACLNPEDAVTPCSSATAAVNLTDTYRATISMNAASGTDRPTIVAGGLVTHVCADLACSSEVKTIHGNVFPLVFNNIGSCDVVTDALGFAVVGCIGQSFGTCGGWATARCADIGCTGVSSEASGNLGCGACGQGTPYIRLDSNGTTIAGSVLTDAVCESPAGRSAFVCTDVATLTHSPCVTADSYNLTVPHPNGPARAWIGLRENGDIIAPPGDWSVVSNPIMEITSGSPTWVGVDLGTAVPFANGGVQGIFQAGTLLTGKLRVTSPQVSTTCVLDGASPSLCTKPVQNTTCNPFCSLHGTVPGECAVRNNAGTAECRGPNGSSAECAIFCP